MSYSAVTLRHHSFPTRRSSDLTRMALGATATDVVRLVARQSLTLLVIGAAIGIAAGVGVGYIMASSMSRLEEHTSELQSQSKIVCILLLEKKIIKRRSVRLV